MLIELFRWLKEVRWTKFFRHFFEAIGTLSAFATLIVFIFNWQPPEKLSWQTFTLISVILGVALLYTYYQLRSNKSVMLTLKALLKVKVKEGRLLSEHGVIVIPVNEYFDTIVNKTIIDKDSIHGQFVNAFLIEHSKDELDQLISTELKRRYHRSTSCPHRHEGNQDKWRLGSCADIDWNGNKYVLFAFTHFNKKNKAYVDTTEVPDIISSLMSHLAEVAGTQPVYMPLFGIGLSRLGKSPKRALLFLLDCIDYTSSNNIKIPGGINIIIPSLSDSDINLDNIENVFKTNVY